MPEKKESNLDSPDVFETLVSEINKHLAMLNCNSKAINSWYKKLSQAMQAIKSAESKLLNPGLHEKRKPNSRENYKKALRIISRLQTEILLIELPAKIKGAEGINSMIGDLYRMVKCYIDSKSVMYPILFAADDEDNAGFQKEFSTPSEA